MFNVDESLAAVGAALAQASSTSTERDLDRAADAATVELQKVAAVVAEFANRLDDGVGYFNSSSEFGRQLAIALDDVRRKVTVSGLLQELSVEETLFVVGVALLHIQVRTGPHGFPRSVLSDGERTALERIRDTAEAALVDSAMPTDPEDEC